MTPEIIDAMSQECLAALHLKELLDDELAQGGDPFLMDELASLYMGTHKRWEALRAELQLFAATSQP